MDYAQPSSSSRDPLQLERLAEELAERELAHKPSGSQNHDLPVYVPLSHSNPYLAASAFNVEDFLLSRSYTSLPDLRAELRDYLATLKEELVKLINDDYEAFISLSTDLRGEGARLERLKWPLGGIRAEVLVSFTRQWNEVHPDHVDFLPLRNLVANCSEYKMRSKPSWRNGHRCETRRSDTSSTLAVHPLTADC